MVYDGLMTKTKRVTYSDQYGEQAITLVMQGMTPMELTAELDVAKTVGSNLHRKARTIIEEKAKKEESLSEMVTYLASIDATAHEVSECLGIAIEDAKETARQNRLRLADISGSPLSVRRRALWKLAATEHVPAICTALNLTHAQALASLQADPWGAYGAEAMELTMHGMDTQDIEWSLGLSEKQSAMLLLRSKSEIAAKIADAEWLGSQVFRLATWGVSCQHAADGLSLPVNLVRLAARAAGVPAEWYITAADQRVNDAILQLLAESKTDIEIAEALKLSGAEEVHARLSLARMDFRDIESQIATQVEALKAEQIRTMVSRGADLAGIVDAMVMDESQVRRIAKKHSVHIRVATFRL